MKKLNTIPLISASAIMLGTALNAQADLIIPTLQNIQDRQAAINYCNGYADTAIQQFAKNQSLDCGFSGPRWNNNRQGQFNWCLTVLEPFAITEQGFRDDALKDCQEKKRNDVSQKNQLAIPPMCKDPSKQYTAVKTIFHHFRYETTRTSPVQNGLISYDYNRDKKPDYVFLEAKQSHSRIAMCFSQGQQYRRQLTDIQFYSGSDGLGSSNYDITQQGDTLVIQINEFEHNAGSSYRKVTYRFDTASKKFAIINNEFDESPVVYDGEAYPMALPATPVLF